MNQNGEDFIKWKHEAAGVIADIQKHVQSIEVTEDLPVEEKRGVYMNVKTLEGNKICVLLSNAGFQVVGKDFNSKDCEESEEIYETIYAAIQAHSPMYTNSFGNALIQALTEIHE